MRLIKVLILTTGLIAAVLARAGDIPPRPEQLAFPTLTFAVPAAEPLRVTLANRIPAYVAEDRMLPLVAIQVLFRGGQYLEPAGKEGVAELTGTVWRTGGAGALDAKALDEELDFLAAQLSTSVHETTGTVTLNILAKDIDRGLALLLDVLRSPRFEEARLAKAKQDLLADMQRRNDDSADIEGREWNRLIYGDGYWLNRLATKASVEGITRADVAAFHARLANPANFIVAVAGDFERPAMIAKLNATLGSWRVSGPAVPPVPQPDAGAKPSVYLVNKPDVNQGRVSVGHLGSRRPVADEFAFRVANDILGGDGFAAWLMQRVRTAEGLAYGAYSSTGIADVYPGSFRAEFQSKSSTCARATQVALELMRDLRAGKASDKDLVTSKNSFIETLPRTFESKFKTVTRFASDEVNGRPRDYWQRYRAGIAAVTLKNVADAATAHVHPDQLVILVVGNIDDILKGHPDHPEAKFERFGTLARVPLRDPMTLQPLAQ
jgi:predicted Zn-dependent peptidase